MFKFLLFSCFAMLLHACLPLGGSSNLVFKTHELPELEEAVPDVVTYEYLRKRVLAPHCIDCHEGMGSEDKLKWWIVAGAPEESELFLWMEDGSMPPERAPTTKELEIVRRYIEQLPTL